MGVSANDVVTADVPRMAAPPMSLAQGAFAAVGASLFRAGVVAANAADTVNFVMSPFSILAALGMAAFGAKGETAIAFADLLGGTPEEIAARLNAVEVAIADAVAAGAAPMNGKGTLTPTIIDNANALFVDRAMHLEQTFLAAMAGGYGTGVRLADFRNEPEESRAAINSWVSERTHALIPELLPHRSVDEDTRLALVNALYLKAAWAPAFSVTPPLSFETANGAHIPVDAIHTRELLAYGEQDGWRAVTAPFGGREVAMTVVLPAPGTFESFVGSFDGDVLSAVLTGDRSDVDLVLPKFSATASLDMADVVQRLGAGALFDDPDFSGMAGRRGDLEIGAFVHQAKIAVDEDGVEAAAATAVMMAGRGLAVQRPEPVRFVVDRPFLYVIAETKTQMPLFVGVVRNPAV